MTTRRVNKNVLLPVLAGSLIILATGCGSNADGDESATADQGATGTGASASATPSPSATLTKIDYAKQRCPNPEEVDVSDVDAVALAYETISRCWDSTQDENTQAGTKRAVALASDDWAKTQQEAETRNAIPNQFRAAAEFDGVTWVEATRSLGDMDADIDGDKAQRGVTTTWHWVGANGESAPGGEAQSIVYLEKHDGAWEVVGTYVTNIHTED